MSAFFDAEDLLSGGSRANDCDELLLELDETDFSDEGTEVLSSACSENGQGAASVSQILADDSDDSDWGDEDDKEDEGDVFAASQSLANMGNEEFLIESAEGEGSHSMSHDEDIASSKSRALTFLQSLTLALLEQLKHSMHHLAVHDPNDILDENSDVDMEPAEAPGLFISLRNRKTGKDTTTSYPSGKISLKKIAQIMQAVACLSQAIVDGVVVTKRDVFYHDVALFQKQAVVDKIVDDLIATAGLRRRDFNVCASSKGLLASSNIRLHLDDGTELVTSARTGTLIPPAERIIWVESTTPLDWVLIVEKDAVFNALLQSKLLTHSSGAGAIITGKGYPDLATLQLLSILAESNANTRFYALVDADPHGLSILSVYTEGSKATRFSNDYKDLKLGDRLTWIGVKASELRSFGVKLDSLLPLANADWTLALSMLRSQPDLSDDLRKELLYMLHMQRKAEIQVLMETEAIMRNDVGEVIGRRRTAVQRLADYIASQIEDYE